MKILPTEFQREGNDYHQIWRQNDVAVFQYGPAPRFELVIIKIKQEEKLPSGMILPHREAYPKTSQWGQYGWTLGPQDRSLAIHIGQQIANLPAVERIPQIHAVMDRWIATRQELQSVSAKARITSASVLTARTG